MQQFLTSSTWEVTDVRRRLAALAMEVIAPTVWVVDDTGFPKCGTVSACVARQYSGTLGKVANCQIGVSVHAATEAASAVLDRRLFVPESWDATCVPDEHGQVTNIHAQRLRDKSTTLDEAGHPKPQVRRKVPAAQQIATTTAHPAQVTPTSAPYPGRGRLSVPCYREPAPTLKALAQRQGRLLRPVSWIKDRDHGVGALLIRTSECPCPSSWVRDTHSCRS